MGVQFDEPMGMNDGTVKGVRLFECADGYGAIVRGSKVQVGDFPERDLMDESDNEEEVDGKPNAEEEEDNEDEI